MAVKPGLLVFLLTLASMAGSLAAEESPYNVVTRLLNDCIERQFETEDSPSSFADIDLQTDCPELSQTLGEHTSLMTAVVADPNTSSLRELADLRYFAQSFEQTPSAANRLDQSGLAALLKHTLDEQKKTAQLSWWERFIGWLNSRNSSDTEPADMDWLQNLLQGFSLSAETARLILYAAAFVTIALALGLILNELRNAKLARRLGRRRRLSRHDNPVTMAASPQTTEIRASDLPHHLPTLLKLCIQYLCAHQRLPDAMSLTNREMLLYLNTQQDTGAKCFEHLYTQAERVIYGGQQPETRVVDQCHQEALSLIGANT